jgi:hypothetical protein
MIENRTLRSVFGPKRDEGTGDWRKLHDKELYDLHSSPNFIRVIKSRKIRWVG